MSKLYLKEESDVILLVFVRHIQDESTERENINKKLALISSFTLIGPSKYKSTS